MQRSGSVDTPIERTAPGRRGQRSVRTKKTRDQGERDDEPRSSTEITRRNQLRVESNEKGTQGTKRGKCARTDEARAGESGRALIDVAAAAPPAAPHHPGDRTSHRGHSQTPKVNLSATHSRRLRLRRSRTARAKRAVTRGHDAARAREVRGGRGSAGAHDGAEETAANPCASRRSKASTNMTASRSRRASASGGGAGPAWRIATEIAIESASASEVESMSASGSMSVSETASATDRAETGTEIESESESETASVCAARGPTRR